MDILTLGLSGYWQGVITVAGIAVIAALGLQLTISSGQFSLVHGALMGTSSYVTGLVTVYLGLDFWLAVLLGGLAGAILGALISALLSRLEGVLFGLATLAIGQALTLVASNTPAIGGTTGFTGVPLNTQMWQVVLIAAVALAAVLMLKGTRVGIGVVSAGRDPVVALSLGIPVRRYKIEAFAAGGALAGIAGALNVQYLSFVDPTALNFGTEVQLVLYVVIGGMATPLGAVLGAVLVTALNETLRVAVLDRAWILGLVLMIVALLRPQGILSRQGIDTPSPLSRWWIRIRTARSNETPTKENHAAG